MPAFRSFRVKGDAWGEVIRAVAAIFDHSARVAFILAGVIVVFQALSVSINTLLGYVFRYSITGVVGVNEFGILFFVFLAAAWLEKNDAHIRMDFLLNRLGPKSHAIVDIIHSTLGMTTFLVITGYGILVTWDAWVRGLTDPYRLESFPKAITLAIIPIGSFLLSTQFAVRIYLAQKQVRGTGIEVIAEPKSQGEK